MQKNESGVKKCLEICAIKGGGGGPLMANAIKNFHFDFLTTSLTSLTCMNVYCMHTSLVKINTTCLHYTSNTSLPRINTMCMLLPTSLSLEEEIDWKIIHIFIYIYYIIYMLYTASDLCIFLVCPFHWTNIFRSEGSANTQKKNTKDYSK